MNGSATSHHNMHAQNVAMTNSTNVNIVKQQEKYLKFSGKRISTIVVST